MPYNSKILDYASRRKHFGALDESEQVGVGYVGNAACGDMLKVYIKVDENDKIIDVKVKSYGCGCAIASTALAAEKLMGKSIDQALQLTDKEIADELDLPGIKKHCSVLAQSAVKKAVENYRSKKTEDDFIELEISKKDLESELSDNKNTCCNAQAADIQEQKNYNNSNAENFLSSKQPFQVTPAALQRFYEIMKLYPQAQGVIITSQAGGCAGNSYNIDIVKQDSQASMKQGDVVKEDCQELANANKYIFDNVVIFVPKSSLMYVLGVTIDYQATETQAGFKFINPNAKMCGCGSSFR